MLRLFSDEDRATAVAKFCVTLHAWLVHDSKGPLVVQVDTITEQHSVLHSMITPVA